MTGDEGRKRAQLTADVLDPRFFLRNVEQRAGVTDGGAAARHCASLSCAA